MNTFGKGSIADNAANMKSAMTLSFIYDFADDTGDDDRGDSVDATGPSGVDEPDL